MNTNSVMVRVIKLTKEDWEPFFKNELPKLRGWLQIIFSKPHTWSILEQTCVEGEGVGCCKYMVSVDTDLITPIMCGSLILDSVSVLLPYERENFLGVLLVDFSNDQIDNICASSTFNEMAGKIESIISS